MSMDDIKWTAVGAYSNVAIGRKGDDLFFKLSLSGLSSKTNKKNKSYIAYLPGYTEMTIGDKTYLMGFWLVEDSSGKPRIHIEE